MEKPFYHGKKFWAMMFMLVIGVLDLTVCPGLWKLLIAPGAYILGQGLADMGKNNFNMPSGTAGA